MWKALLKYRFYRKLGYSHEGSWRASKLDKYEIHFLLAFLFFCFLLVGTLDGA